MTKILLAIDPMNPDRPSIEFASFLAVLTKSKLIAVFLENTAHDTRLITHDAKVMASRLPIDEVPDVSGRKTIIVEQTIDQFKNHCEREGIEFRIHRDRGEPRQELITESRFADLIVVSSETTFSDHFDGIPTHFVAEVLRRAECPIIVSPKTFNGVNEIVLTYDRSSSSVYAMKLLSYLVPQFSKINVTVVSVADRAQTMDHHKYIFMEWLHGHFEHVNHVYLDGDSEIALFNFLVKRENALVVLGAYGRSSLSQFFKHSVSDFLMKTISNPLFIAHL